MSPSCEPFLLSPLFASFHESRSCSPPLRCRPGVAIQASSSAKSACHTPRAWCVFSGSVRVRLPLHPSIPACFPAASLSTPLPVSPPRSDHPNISGRPPPSPPSISSSPPPSSPALFSPYKLNTPSCSSRVSRPVPLLSSPTLTRHFRNTGYLCIHHSYPITMAEPFVTIRQGGSPGGGRGAAPGGPPPPPPAPGRPQGGAGRGAGQQQRAPAQQGMPQNVAFQQQLPPFPPREQIPLRYPQPQVEICDIRRSG